MIINAFMAFSRAFLRLLILFYVVHESIGVYVASKGVVEVQLVVEIAFTQHRHVYLLSEEQEANKCDRSYYNQYYSHGNSCRSLRGFRYDFGYRDKKSSVNILVMEVWHISLGK